MVSGERQAQGISGCHPGKIGVKGLQRRQCRPEGKGETTAQPEMDPVS